MLRRRRKAARPPVHRRNPTTDRAANASDYRLVAGDKLRIEIYKDPQLSQNLQVRPDGKITLPLLGDVMAAGETPTALRDRITLGFKEYMTNPVVTVIVVEAQPPTVSVMGEVNNPGVQPLKYPMTVIDALAIAGGFKDFANTKNIMIKRHDGARCPDDQVRLQEGDQQRQQTDVPAARRRHHRSVGDRLLRQAEQP